MGYQVEYLIALPAAAARQWLSTCSGTWFDQDVEAELPYGEFERDGLALHVELAPTACHLRVPEIKYSWLIHEHAPSLERIARLDAWLRKSLPEALIVRIDEFVFEKWNAEHRHEWHRLPSPAAALLDRLTASHEETAHYRILPTES